MVFYLLAGKRDDGPANRIIHQTRPCRAAKTCRPWATASHEISQGSQPMFLKRAGKPESSLDGRPQLAGRRVHLDAAQDTHAPPAAFGRFLPRIRTRIGGMFAACSRPCADGPTGPGH